MRRDDVIVFLKRKIRLTCKINEFQSLNYTGLVTDVNEESLTMRDKFDKIVVVSLRTIDNISEV